MKIQRKPRKKRVADVAETFAINLAEQDATGVPLMPKSANAVSDLIDAHLISVFGHARITERERDAAIGAYGRKLQKHVNERV